MPDDPLSGMTPDEKRLFETVQRRGQEPTMPDDPRSVAWEQYRWHGADDAGGSERPAQWRYAFDAGWKACEEQHAARLQQAERDRAFIQRVAQYLIVRDAHDEDDIDMTIFEGQLQEIVLEARALYPPETQP